METFDLIGTYTYRSFINNPAVVGDFDALHFAEAELTLFSTLGGQIAGMLSWPKNADDSLRDQMDITGEVVSREPFLIRLEGIGRKGSGIETYDYKYELTLARQWPETTTPRVCLVGSVIRARDHGTAKAGVTASVIAVKRDFVEPRDMGGVALTPSTIAMLAGKWHRLWHAAWHTVRGMWPNFIDQSTRDGISALGWGVTRPPRKSRSEGSGLILDNGAGEDFLFMHRWMIKMVRDDYARQGLPPPASWKRVPSPLSAQLAYSSVVNAAGLVEFKRDIAASGNMVPPAADWAKSQEYFNTVMRQWENQFTGAATLASLSLGALGNLLEFTIHNAMHNRWMSPARDPDTGAVILDPQSGGSGSRPTFDFSDKWSSPKYDYLGEFYSSHVNPVFWRLHGWVDDRIDDWFRAQESARPGTIRRRQLHGADWFEVNSPWVMVAEPFVGVALDGHMMPGGGGHGHGGHDHGGGQAAEIDNMLKVMALIEHDGEQRAVAAPGAPALTGRERDAATPRQAPRVSMRFEMPDQM